MSNTLIVGPLVGMHFRPPAKGVLAALPAGCQLSVVPEPDNAYDANALKVCVDLSTQPEAVLAEVSTQIAGYGYELTQINSAPFHLGYIKATVAATVKLPPEGTTGKLVFDMAGKPEVQFIA